MSKKVLFSAIVGSKLYGIANEDSDTDIRGVCLQPIESLLGLHTKEKYEESNGLTGKDKVESIHFCLNKYIQLVLKGNPTILEMAFVPDEFIIKDTKLGWKVREFVRNHCISKEVFPAYMGYFQSQVTHLKKKNTEGKRQELIDKYGYDVKFAAHAVRIALQAIDIFKSGAITPKIKGLHLIYIKRIHAGEVPFNAVIQLLTELETDMKEAKDNSTIRAMVNTQLVDSFLIGILKDYIGGKNVD